MSIDTPEEKKIIENCEYKNQYYTIGMEVVAVDSEYTALTGVVTEISSKENEETGERDLIIFCDFEVPEGTEKYYEGLTFNSVVMAPEMLIEKLPELSLDERCDLTTSILHYTNDGDDLSPPQLNFIQNAANGNLNLYGEYMSIPRWNRNAVR